MQGQTAKLVHSFTQNSLLVVYRKVFTNADTCIPMHIYSKIHKQKDVQEQVCRPELEVCRLLEKALVHRRGAAGTQRQAATSLVEYRSTHGGYAHRRKKNMSGRV